MQNHSSFLSCDSPTKNSPHTNFLLQENNIQNEEKVNEDPHVLKSAFSLKNSKFPSQRNSINDGKSPSNLPVPRSVFSRTSQKFKTVTFSNNAQLEPSNENNDVPMTFHSKFYEAKNKIIPENSPIPKENKNKNALYNYLQDFLHFTLGNDDDEDIHHKIEEEAHLKKELTEIPQLFRQHTRITNKRRPDFLKVTHMSKIEKVYVDFDFYPDKYPFKKTRKYLVLASMYMEYFSLKFIKSKLFEVFSLIVILMNCITYILKQNREGEYVSYLDTINQFETTFLVFYLIEMSLKFVSFGLFVDKHAYFRDGWNILDFFVIINLVLLNSNVTFGLIKDYSLLRIIRLMRPLRALTRFKQLRTIISSLLAALPLLLDFLLILLFFFLIYAAVGLNLFSGLLSYRCFDPIIGVVINEDIACGNAVCMGGTMCARGIESSIGGIINFDNLFSAILQVMLIATLDNWTVTMYNVQRAFTNYAWIYFVSLVVFGNYILLNLTLALIKVKFSETHLIIKNEKKKINTLYQTYEFSEIKRQGLWIDRRKNDHDSKSPAYNNNNGIAHNNNNGSVTNPKNSVTESDHIEERQIIKLMKEQVQRPISKFNQYNSSQLQKYNSALNIHHQPLRSSFRNSGNIVTRRFDQEIASAGMKPIHSSIQSPSIASRRGAGVIGTHMSSYKSKTFRSYKSHNSSVISKKNKNKRISPFPSSFNNKSMKYEPHMSSESFLSFISLDEKRGRVIRANFSNKYLQCLVRFFAKVLLKIPVGFRKNIKHQTLFNINPKYLKLIVDFEREYKSISENDILPDKDAKNQKKMINEQLNLFKQKKLPIVYAPKKKKASLLKFLRQVYSKKFATQTNLGNNNNKDVFLGSSNSNSSLNSIEEKFFKTVTAKKGLALKLTRRITTKNKLKSPKDATMNSQTKLAIDFAENYVVNLNDLFDKKEDFAAKEKNNQNVKKMEIVRKKLEELLSKKNKNDSPTELNNYIWIKNLINENIDDNKDDDKDEKESIENENLQSIDMAKKYLEIRKKDLEHNNIHSYTWSGDEVLSYSFVETAFNKIFEQLNDGKNLLYYEETKGHISKLRCFIRRFLMTRLFHLFLILMITSYMIFISLSSGLENSEAIQANLVYTSIFLVEIFLKIFALGWKAYIRDHLNKIDSLVVWASILEIILLSDPNLNEFRYIRFLTAIKIFRIARVIQNIKFIKFLISVISRTLSSFIYLAILLILLNFVYALVGMEVYGGKLDKNSATYFNMNFDTFWVAFLTVFNIVTLDNWIDVMREGFDSDIGVTTTSLFVISWIVIGNFLLLNLFLAIMLDGFTRNMEMQELQQIIDEEQEEKEKDEYIKGKVEGHRREEFNIIIPKDARQGFVDELTKYFVYNSKYNEKYNEKETKLLTLLEMDIIKEKTQYSAYQATNYLPMHKIACELSLWIWSKNSFFRQFCHGIVFHIYFQNLMIFTVCLSTLVIILQTYLNQENDLTLKYVTDSFDYVCLTIFLFQAILKIIVLGFYSADKSYIRSYWNRLDLFILSIYFLEFWLNTRLENYFFFSKLVKMGKVMRPLSLINYNPNIYTVCKALWESTLDILKVLFVIFIIWFTYALLGIILFRGRFGFCNNLNNYNVNRQNCLEKNGSWQIFAYNFDNIYNAFITLFVISTFDGWNEIMSVAVNSDVETYGPQPFNNQYSSYIFFLSFVIFGAMFLINLFTGVIFYNFTMAEKMTKHKYLSDSQVTWLNLHKLIVLADPYFEYSKPPSSLGKRIIFNAIRSKIFRFFIYACLIANIVILLISYKNMSSQASDEDQMKIIYVHQTFNLIFLLEGILKIFIFGFKGYIFDDWNKLDLFIIFTGILDFFITFIWPSYLRLIRIGPQLVKGLRIIRILRLIRVLRKRRGIDKLLHTLMFSLPMVLNIFSLLMLIYYIYAMFGYYVFGEILSGGIIDDYINFKNFSYSLMTLYKVSTADGWEDLMMTISNNYSWAPIYFISFYIITTYVLINLLVLVLLQQFENYHNDPGNPIHTFKDYLLKFRSVWGIYTSKQKGKKIHHRLLIPFFQKLSPPMGFEEFEDIDIMLKIIMEMKLISDYNGFIGFNDVLYSTLKRVYHRIIYQNKNELCIKQLELADEKIRFNLQAKKEIKKHRLRRSTFSPQEMSEYLKKFREYNPLTAFFYSRMSFYAWRNYTDSVFEKLIQINLRNEPAAKNNENVINENIITEYSEENIISNTSSSSEDSDKLEEKPNNQKNQIHNPSRIDY